MKDNLRNLLLGLYQADDSMSTNGLFMTVYGHNDFSDSAIGFVQIEENY